MKLRYVILFMFVLTTVCLQAQNVSNENTEMFSTGYDRNVAQAWASTNIVAPYTMDCSKGPESYTMGGWAVKPEQTDMNIGFNVPSVGDASVTPQVEDTRHWECSHNSSDEEDVVYTLLSPVIECGKDIVNFDMHMHKKGFGWGAHPGAYDEWEENDYLTFYVVSDGREIELEKYTSANAFTAQDGDEDDAANVWHKKDFDLSGYEGKNIQFGMKWHCESSSNVWFSFENFTLTNSVPARIEAVDKSDAESAPRYNLAGQRVNNSVQNEVTIQNSKKFVK